MSIWNRSRASSGACGHAHPPGDSFAKLSQQVAQIGLDEGCRSQFHQQGAHFGQCPTAQLSQVLQELSPLILIAFPDSRQCFGDEAGRKQGLGDGVVQLPRQALALLHHGQLLGLLVEAGVLDGDGCLGSDGGQQVEVPLIIDILGGVALHANDA